jgi:two-component system cell cycle response regulator
MKTTIMRALPLLAAVGVSLGILVAVLWERSPLLAAVLVAPVAALVLYERSIRRGRAAMRLALTDPLTGLGNQRAFRDRLRRELARAKADGKPLALCVLDVDDFKRINDEHGHPAGDLVLTEVAATLRHDGEAFRLGGDEFALLLLGLEVEAAVAAAEAVVHRVAALSVHEVGRVTVSAGLAAFPPDGTTRDELTTAADERLYGAKRHGGNRLAAPTEPLAATGDGA